MLPFRFQSRTPNPERRTPSPILCVLAGGRSSRFGSSKLRLRVGGRPIITWLAERLGRLGGERWLSVAPGAELPPGAGGFDRIIVDRAGYRGPLPAMAQVLLAAPARTMVIFAAADMPLVDPAHLASMLRLLRRHGAVAAMSRWCGGDHAGQVEPLPSIWRAGRGVKLIRRALLSGVRGPHQLADWRGVVCAPIGGVTGVRCFANINRKEDAARWPLIAAPFS